LNSNNDKKIAVRESWKTEPPPEMKERLPFEATYSEEEFGLLVVGSIPQDMNDHWFVFFEEPWLYFHRSWTGIYVFAIQLEQKATRWEVTEAWASRDLEERRGSIDTYPMSIEHDLAMLKLLIQALLLHRYDDSGHLRAQIHQERVKTGMFSSAGSTKKSED